MAFTQHFISPSRPHDDLVAALKNPLGACVEIDLVFKA